MKKSGTFLGDRQPGRMPLGLRWVCVVMIASLGAGCSAKDDVPEDPVEYYGPCTDNPHCGMGSQLASVSSEGDCLCKVFCEEDADCPIPSSGSSEPVCVLDDFFVDGMNGECALPCSESELCPDELVCITGTCRGPG